MKPKLHALFIVFLLLIAQPKLIAQQFRVKSLTCTEYDAPSNTNPGSKTASYNFVYSNGQIERINDVTLKYQKDKIQFSSNSQQFFVLNLNEIKLTKEGKLEKRGNYKLKYHKDGNLKEAEYKMPIFLRQEEVFLYDEKNRIRVVGEDLEYNVNTILCYDQDNRCTEIVYGNYKAESTKIEWEGKQVKSISNYTNGNRLGLITRHQFKYDANGNLVEELIYTNEKSWTKEDKKEYLVRHYIAEYEDGQGNDSLILFEHANPFVNVLLGQRSFFIPTYAIY